MYSLVSDLIVTAMACKRELLIGLASGAAFSLVMFLLRPLARWRAARNEVQRLLYSEKERVSTYVLAGLAYGFWSAGTLVIIPLGATAARLAPAGGFFAILLFLLGSSGLALIHMLLARRLARQLITMGTLSLGR